MATAQNAVAAAVTPRRCRSKIQELPKHAENLNPNVLQQQQQQSPGCRKPLIPNSSSSASSISPSSPSPSSSPVVSKSCSVTASKSQKPKNPAIPISSFTPRTKIRQRKFVVAKKTQKEEEQEKEKERSAGETTSFCKCKEKKGSGGGIRGKCLCVAYHNLRKSQEEFFKNRCDGDDDGGDEDEEIECVVETEEMGNGGLGETECGGLAMKRTRERLVKAAMEKESGPQSGGSGKVKNLVQAFEKLLLAGPISKDEGDHKEKEEEEEEKEPQQNDHKVMKWPPTNLTLTSQNLGLDPRDSVSSSWDSGRGSLSRRTSNGGRSSRRNSLESSSTFGGRRWKKKQQKITNPRPFKLRTEQRGMLKEEEFVKKVQEMMTEEEKQRVPVAQGLPWTTDEPECLVKPPVKEITIPVDLKLHSDVRAVDRAEFDNQVAEKLSLMEQYKLEKERQQKLEEEEEIRRLRRELVPKAQPMPYFDRPFIPRRSMKNPTMPRTPKFHKKIKCSSASWSDMSTYSFLN
ncbi:microtubule-destabilizing protein 60-like isoform X2 [Lotus japonicus]|uniref:microtubule-destabilizing protein 60-like isoform X2 n=1 Tax=Lotus japonicus TaxID=34305 RepID=UPI00258B017D|nr:microtubule-destabilizing protein 60-like isoform X2 [Lotus japonicus]